MAGEIQLPGYISGKTHVYAVIRNSVGQVWQTTTSTFVTYVTANLANYATALTEQGTASGVYVGTFPAAITSGVYNVTIYDGATATPVETDPFAGGGEIQWNGAAVMSVDAVLNGANGVCTGFSLARMQRLIVSMAGSKLSGITGSAPYTIVGRDVLDTLNAFTAVVDANGNCTSLTINGGL